MGKVVKTVAAIAVAVAISYFAPQLGAAFLTAVGTTAAAAGAAGVAAATALAASVLTVAGGLLMRELAPAPGSYPAGYAPTKALPTIATADFRFVQEEFPTKIGCPLQPVDPPCLSRPFHLFSSRYAISGTQGDCMVPVVPRRAYIVVDRIASIAPGDLFVFSTNDLLTGTYTMGMNWRTRWRLGGLVKRYDGLDPQSRTLYFHCLFPKMQRIATGQDRLTYAYRVVSSHRSWWQAWRACRQLRAATRQRR
jgi:hypothetical protein